MHHSPVRCGAATIFTNRAKGYQAIPIPNATMTLVRPGDHRFSKVSSHFGHKTNGYAHCIDNKLVAKQNMMIRDHGAGFFCVTWLAFWLLEWPPVLRTYLDKRTDCLKHTRDIAIYKLAPLQPLMRGPDISARQPSSR